MTAGGYYTLNEIYDMGPAILLPKEDAERQFGITLFIRPHQGVIQLNGSRYFIREHLKWREIRQEEILA